MTSEMTLPYPSETAKESLYDTLVFSSRDWSQDPTDAWLYGIVAGWPANVLHHLAGRFGWTDEDVARLSRLHKDFERTATWPARCCQCNGTFDLAAICGYCQEKYL